MKRRNKSNEVSNWIASNRPMIYQFEDWTTHKNRVNKLLKESAWHLFKSGFWEYDTDSIPTRDYVVRFVDITDIKHLVFLEIKRK